MKPQVLTVQVSVILIRAYANMLAGAGPGQPIGGGNDLGCLILQGGQGMQDVTTWSCHILIIINIVSIIDQSLIQGYVKFLD